MHHVVQVAVASLPPKQANQTGTSSLTLAVRKPAPRLLSSSLRRT